MPLAEESGFLLWCLVYSLFSCFESLLRCSAFFGGWLLTCPVHLEYIVRMKTSRIEFRISAYDKTRWSERAAENGMSLSSWIIQIVNLSSHLEISLSCPDEPVGLPRSGGETPAVERGNRPRRKAEKKDWTNS